MKNLIALCISILIVTGAIAQEGINYKALIKDTNGNVVANQSVDLQFTILKGAAQTHEYTETHTVMTDNNGIVIANIGEGTPTSGTYAAIVWSSDEHHLNVQVDIGSGFVNMGTAEFKSVPYALSAANVSGLEAINEGNGIGWRLKGKNPSFYGNVGQNAVDLTTSFSSNITNGATGTRSFATGTVSIASGNQSTSIGSNTIASGSNSIAIGHYAEASGFASTSIGNNTIASGIYSTAVGVFNEDDPLAYFMIGNGVDENNRDTALVVKKNGDFVVGSSQLDDDGVLSHKSRFFFNKAKGAFRAGNVNGDRWDDSNVGLNSIALGRNGLASGETSVVLGNSNVASSLASLATGEATIASGGQATTFGSFTTASGNFSIAAGQGTIASGDGTLAIGQYNEDDSDAYFIVGNGAFNSPDTALVLKKNGDFVVGSPQLDYDGQFSHLRRMFFNKSKAAFRAGFSSETHWDDANIGLYSTATGSQTRASGAYSVAMGEFSIASGEHALAIGATTHATGYRSVALGEFTLASGSRSTAIGSHSTASGNYSTASGNSTIASGDSAIALGKFNVDNSNALFSLGYGTSNASRVNAITVLQNGNVGISRSNPQVRLQVVSGTDASLTDGTGYFLIGFQNGTNIVMDTNEIQARSNGAASTLFLQQAGGNVAVNGSVVHTSDRRLKRDIQTLNYGLTELLKLNPVSYYWKDKPNQSQKSLGLIAQDLQAVISELVSVENDELETLHVNYTEMIPVLIKAIQEQQQIIEVQKLEIDNMSAEINHLKRLDSRVSELEAILKNIEE